MKSICVGTVALLSSICGAQEYVTIDLSPYRNSQTGDYFNPFTYPTGLNCYDGAPFAMPESNAADALYAWNAFYGTDDPVVLEIAVGVEGVDVAYTIMNTFWGSEDPGTVGIEFIGSDGAFEEHDLIGNDDIRDFNNNKWTNEINGVTTIEIFNNGIGQRLDRQMFDLGDDFLDQTLETIRIVDNGATKDSRAFIVAATVERPAEVCAADCNGDGTLNILDFVCYQQLFQAGAYEADCNCDNELSILDFVCFQTRFEAGCP